LSLRFEVDFLSPKKNPDVYITVWLNKLQNDVLNISDLCFVNYEYMFKNCSLKLEKATVS